jgi:predicted transcriptional regulator of viral defense system
MNSPHNHTLASYVEHLQSNGRYTFTTEELSSHRKGTSVSHRSAIRRLCQKHRLARPTHGFQVIVPTEYMFAGAPPASWFIDDLMHFLHRPYYVGLLSAASLHGASHQQPQEFQVVTSRTMRPIVVGRTNIKFYRNRNLPTVLTEQHKTVTGYITVSTIEATMLDIVRAMDSCGGLSTIATIILELAPFASPDKLSSAGMHAKQTTLQRLGYILEQLHLTTLANSLDAIIANHRKHPTLLRASSKLPNHAESIVPDIVRRWNIIPNESIELEA